MDREETVCTYTILDDDVTVIEDVTQDPRFNQNEGLAAAGIRFYAGAPIITPQGHPIGVFCLHDDEPRRFSKRDQYLITLLADLTMDQLELEYLRNESIGEDV